MDRAKAKGESAVQMILKARCMAMPESCSQGEKAVNKFREFQKDVKAGHLSELLEKDLSVFTMRAEESLRSLKRSDPALFKETLRSHVSTNPIFLQLAEELL